MNQHTNQSAALNATKRIIALVAPFIPASERELLWGRIFFCSYRQGSLPQEAWTGRKNGLRPAGNEEMKLLSVREAAEQAGVSESLVYQWIEERRLAHYRLGGQGKRGKIGIDSRDLATFLESLRIW